MFNILADVFNVIMIFLISGKADHPISGKVTNVDH